MKNVIEAVKTMLSDPDAKYHGLSGENKFTMISSLKQEMYCFYLDSSSNKRATDWIDRIEALIAHWHGLHDDVS